MTTNTPVVSDRLSDAAALPLRTLDPAAPLDDLEWLDQAVGDARVVAIGESAHYNREFFRLRHRLLRYLAERHGFSAYAMETGFVEGELVDNWVRGEGDAGAERLGHVMANGMTSLMGAWAPMRAHLEWMRRHNHSAAHPVGFYGVDMPGSMVSLLPGLDAVTAYLALVDPEFPVDPALRETAAAFAAPSAFAAPAAIAAYGDLATERRNALTAGLADLTAHLTSRRLTYVRRTSADAFARALHALRVTVTLDAMLREIARGNRDAMSLIRDARIADTVEWVLEREDRIVLAAHNGHVQRAPHTMPGMPVMPMAGAHLADRLGSDYVVIGTTTGTGQTLNTAPDFYTGTLFADLEETPRSGSLDALMNTGHRGPFAVDLRRLSAADTAAVRSVSQQRYGTYYADQSPLAAFDVVVHLPHVTAAEPDPAALAEAPRDVREPFASWMSTA
ncbi:erythromycin esterase family protein [Streptomyces sp. GS7]|uniref:erythromycin esterase family protein n=1 Tax=Streptomyces sp. GS7 TaxID=2692234 RepID=UPI0013191218|nr:erythromycin esterase family protein [Streptomyces sp. GS7]QHC22698.1 erythromycin esterase family protein [Streptomyces sp. GS7]